MNFARFTLKKELYMSHENVPDDQTLNKGKKDSNMTVAIIAMVSVVGLAVFFLGAALKFWSL